jgi:hypothetical protein
VSRLVLVLMTGLLLVFAVGCGVNSPPTTGEGAFEVAAGTLNYNDNTGASFMFVFNLDGVPSEGLEVASPVPRAGMGERRLGVSCPLGPSIPRSPVCTSQRTDCPDGTRRHEPMILIPSSAEGLSNQPANILSISGVTSKLPSGRSALRRSSRSRSSAMGVSRK